MSRRSRTLTTLAVAAATVGVVPIVPVVTGATAATPITGSLSAVISQGARPQCFTAKYQPTDGYRCAPAAMAAAVLANGKVMFWDGLEGMNKVDLSVVAEFGDVAQNDQSRVVDFSDNGAHPTFTIPGNQAGDGNGVYAEPVN